MNRRNLRSVPGEERMMAAATDAELMSEALTAPAAFELLVHRHHGAIHRYVARRLGPVSAEDIVSEVFATAFAIRARYDHSRPNARPWLFSIATNMIRRHARREAEILDAYSRAGVHPELPGSGWSLRSADRCRIRFLTRCGLPASPGSRGGTSCAC